MKVDISNTGIKLSEETALMERIKNCRRTLLEQAFAGSGMTGWVELPRRIPEELIGKISSCAEVAKDKCSLFIVAGIGGSYLGARAVDDILGGPAAGRPQIVFAGFNMSAAYLARLCRRIESEDACLCAISKSGGTMETLLAYSILKEKLLEKYGAGARERIYIITGDKGRLYEEAEALGLVRFPVPENIGGRYSVLSCVGLLPIAAAGHDVRAMLRGARDMAEDERWNGELLHYCAARLALQKKGSDVEIFEYFEHDFRYFGEWLKQLFGESEGKGGRGAYPACLCFTRDLHSIGQFLQQGHRIFSETLISADKQPRDISIPARAGRPYAGKTLEQINRCAQEGVVAAHAQAGIPICRISVPRTDEYNVGQLIYFFEMSAALSASALGLDPFDQPGVEAYKTETNRLLRQMDAGGTN